MGHMIRLVASPLLKVNARDFGIRASEDRVLLPTDLYDGLRSFGVRSVDDLVATLEDFPSSFVGITRLSTAQVATARENALNLLRRSFPKESFAQSEDRHTSFPGGAASPESLER